MVSYELLTYISTGNTCWAADGSAASPLAFSPLSPLAAACALVSTLFCAEVNIGSADKCSGAIRARALGPW